MSIHQLFLNVLQISATDSHTPCTLETLVNHDCSLVTLLSTLTVAFVLLVFSVRWKNAFREKRLRLRATNHTTDILTDLR